MVTFTEDEYLVRVPAISSKVTWAVSVCVCVCVSDGDKYIRTALAILYFLDIHVGL